MHARPHVTALLTAAALLAIPASASPQDRPLVTPDDYGRWERLGADALAPLGDWVAYVVTRVDETSELRVRKLADDSTRVFPWGSAPAFSPDGRWLAWTVGVSPDERENSDEPVRDKASLMDLRTGGIREFDAVSERAFDASAGFLALRGYAPDEPAGKGADIRIVNLATRAETAFGNVAEMAWSPTGSLLALAVATGTDVGNGVQVYDAETGTLRSADASGSAYRSLRWRDDSHDLAVLRSRDAASADGTAWEVLAWRELDRGIDMTVLGPNTAGIPDTLELVRHRAPSWSDDGRMISVGLRPVEDRADEEGQGGDPGDGDVSRPEETAPQGPAAEEAEPDLPDLQIWHTKDVRLYPEQSVNEGRDGSRTLLAVWHLEDDRVVVLGSDLMANAQLLHGWETALEDTDEPYPWGAKFGRPYHDVRAIDTGTGERRPLLTRVRYEWPSATGEWLLSWDGSAYHTLNIRTGAKHDVTSGLAENFANTDFDTPTDVIPPHGFGPGPWLEDDDAVLLYGKHDIWRVAPDGSGGERLTRGAETGIAHRVARVVRSTTTTSPGSIPIRARICPSTTRRRNSAATPASRTAGRTRGAGRARRTRGAAETLILDDALPGGPRPGGQHRHVMMYASHVLRRPARRSSSRAPTLRTQPRRRPSTRSSTRWRGAGRSWSISSANRAATSSSYSFVPRTTRRDARSPRSCTRTRCCPPKCTSSASPANGTTTTTRPGRSTGTRCCCRTSCTARGTRE